MLSVKLFGGPLDGTTVLVPASVDSYRVGPFWTYTYAGKDGGQTQFALRPKSRRARKFIFWYVGKHGKDPRVETAFSKAKPHVGRTDKRGQGAARRAAKRVA